MRRIAPNRLSLIFDESEWNNAPNRLSLIFDESEWNNAPNRLSLIFDESEWNNCFIIYTRSEFTDFAQYFSILFMF
jgi:predicted neuraminidase